MIDVFIGDVGEYLSHKAKQHDPNAKLFCDANQIAQANTFYTSLADCRFEDLFFLMEKSSSIHYEPPVIWSDKSTNPYSLKYQTEKLLDFFQTCSDKIITGFQKTPYQTECIDHDFLDLTAQRKTTSPQLWVSGCSISHGVAIDKKQRYGQLIADKLGLEVSWLTHTGSSIQWARDQILRSNIQKDDIVCWGITTTSRFSYYDKKLNHVYAGFYKDNKWLNNIINIEKLDDEDQLYQCVTAIYQVQNFCNKIGAKLYMLDMFSQDENQIKSYCSDLKNFQTVLGKNDFTLDYGSDQMHPGPLQHMMYAQYFLEMIKNEC